MGVLVTNNAWGQLSVAITAQSTQLLLSGGQGERFPSATEGVSYFYATIVDSKNNIEIVKCTARQADTLTVVRGADNTEPRAFLDGSRVELRPCAALLNDKVSSDDLEAAVSEAVDTMKAESDRTYELLNNAINNVKLNYLSYSDFNLKIADYATKSELSSLQYVSKKGDSMTGALKITTSATNGLEVTGSNINIAKSSSNGGNLTAAGAITATGTVTSKSGVFGPAFQVTSDIRKKKNVKPFLPNEGQTLVSALCPIWFDWAADGRHDVGLIAQEVQKVVPEVVRVGEDGYLTINYPALVAVAFAAIRDLQNEIKELKCRES